ncbi:hypothetical protein DN752_19225 [Echinicola strongylocentroti]|uniref:Uncharacterized protein n=1 Tax=Echinicola strongylocentroti TaxID=1795355 RepID=A0A2Z4IND1_9BACT|nr:hypothetical protein DN752_19225 [Echinicola strongylocentroti]
MVISDLYPIFPYPIFLFITVFMANYNLVLPCNKQKYCALKWFNEVNKDTNIYQQLSPMIKKKLTND